MVNVIIWLMLSFGYCDHTGNVIIMLVILSFGYCYNLVIVITVSVINPVISFSPINITRFLLVIFEILNFFLHVFKLFVKTFDEQYKSNSSTRFNN
jgi:hypothetical protein